MRPLGRVRGQCSPPLILMHGLNTVSHSDQAENKSKHEIILRTTRRPQTSLVSARHPVHPAIHQTGNENATGIMKPATRLLRFPLCLLLHHPVLKCHLSLSQRPLDVQERKSTQLKSSSCRTPTKRVVCPLWHPSSPRSLSILSHGEPKSKWNGNFRAREEGRKGREEI